MEYPDELYSKDLNPLPKEQILDEDYLYQRHKPGHGWKPEEGLPDYTKIEISPEKGRLQSYNWSRFSKPHWVRFNSAKQYLIEYAVVGFLPRTIRNIHEYDPVNKEYDPEIIKGTLDVEHKPEEINYSHCQLLCNFHPALLETRKITKKAKRSMKIALRHGAKTIYKPYEEV